MLVKWAIEGRRRLAKGSLSGNAEDQHGRASAPAPFKTHPSASSARVTDHSQISQHPASSETPAQDPSLTAELDRLHYSAALAKSSETADDRAMRRIHAEEKASSLRDDKLLSLTGTGGHAQGLYQENEPSQLPLTQENMQKLEQEADPAVSRRPRDLDRHSNVDQARSDSVRRTNRSGSTRPSLQAARMESEQTVTGRAPR